MSKCSGIGLLEKLLCRVALWAHCLERLAIASQLSVLTAGRVGQGKEEKTLRWARPRRQQPDLTYEELRQAEHWSD